jgi:hypothetical protein
MGMIKLKTDFFIHKSFELLKPATMKHVRMSPKKWFQQDHAEHNNNNIYLTAIGFSPGGSDF